MLLVDVIPRRYNEEFKNVKILVSVILVFTLANCDWHFLDVIVGSVPLWVTVNTGIVETGKEICGPGTTTLSFGSSAG